VLIFTASNSTPRSGPVRVQVSGTHGLEPEVVANRLKASGYQVGELIGASVETGIDGTMSYYRSVDGSGVAVHASASRVGSSIRVFELVPTLISAQVQTGLSRPGEALAFSADVQGHECWVVVSSSEFDHASLESVVETYHTPFTEAVKAYPLARLGGLRVTSPREGSGKAQLAMARGLATTMLGPVGGTAYR
jgi:hypothetical protein